MKRLENVYEKIYDFENLHQAYLEARKGKRYRQDVLRFTANLEENLIQLQNELIWKTYKVGRYREFYVTEPKKRLVMALQFRDRVIQWAIYRQLNPFFDKRFIHDSYGCRLGKGTHNAADRLQYWMRKASRQPGDWHYLKLDISKYFYRVDHATLLSILGRYIEDADLMELLATIIDDDGMAFGLPDGTAPTQCPAEERLRHCGMPIGNLTSQMFANVYLHELDHYAKNELRIRRYVRYMDDIIILHHDKRTLAGYRNGIEHFLAHELKLALNRKTVIRAIRRGVEFVGCRMWPTHRKMRKSTIRRIRVRVRHLAKATARNPAFGDKLNKCAASYHGMLAHFNSHGFERSLNKTLVRHLGKSWTGFPKSTVRPDYPAMKGAANEEVPYRDDTQPAG